MDSGSRTCPHNLLIWPGEAALWPVRREPPPRLLCHAAGWPEGPRRLRHAAGWPERRSRRRDRATAWFRRVRSPRQRACAAGAGRHRPQHLCSIILSSSFHQSRVWCVFSGKKVTDTRETGRLGRSGSPRTNWMREGRLVTLRKN